MPVVPAVPARAQVADRVRGALWGEPSARQLSPWAAAVPRRAAHTPHRLPGPPFAGIFVADALAMPAHWYYDVRQIKKDFGEIRGYLPAPKVHPGSM